MVLHHPDSGTVKFVFRVVDMLGAWIKALDTGIKEIESGHIPTDPSPWILEYIGLGKTYFRDDENSLEIIDDIYNVIYGLYAHREMLAEMGFPSENVKEVLIVWMKKLRDAAYRALETAEPLTREGALFKSEEDIKSFLADNGISEGVSISTVTLSEEPLVKAYVVEFRVPENVSDKAMIAVDLSLYADIEVMSFPIEGRDPLLIVGSVQDGMQQQQHVIKINQLPKRKDLSRREIDILDFIQSDDRFASARPFIVEQKGFGQLGEEGLKLLGSLDASDELVEWGIGPDNTYIVTKKVEGFNLTDILDGNVAVSGRDLVNYIILIVQALMKLHEVGINHRDLTPDEIFIDPSTQQVKFVDFELAWILDDPKFSLQSIFNRGFGSASNQFIYHYMGEEEQPFSRDTQTIIAITSFLLDHVWPANKNDESKRLKALFAKYVDFNQAIEAAANGSAEMTLERFLEILKRVKTDLQADGAMLAQTRYTDHIVVLDPVVGLAMEKTLRLVHFDQLTEKERNDVIRSFEQDWLGNKDIVYDYSVRINMDILENPDSDPKFNPKNIFVVLSEENRVEGYFLLNAQGIGVIEVHPDNRQQKRFKGVGKEMIAAAFYQLMIRTSASELKVHSASPTIENTITTMLPDYVKKFDYKDLILSQEEAAKLVEGQLLRTASLAGVVSDAAMLGGDTSINETARISQAEMERIFLEEYLPRLPKFSMLDSLLRFDSDDKQAFIQWFASDDVLPSSVLVRKILANIKVTARTAQDHKTLLHSLTSITAQRMGISNEHLFYLARFIMNRETDILTVSDQILEEFLKTYMRMYQQAGILNTHFRYPTVESVGIDEKLKLATENMQFMMATFDEDFLRGKSVVKVFIEGTPYFLGVRFGFGASTAGIEVLLGKEKGTATPHAGVFFRAGFDIYKKSLRNVRMGGVRNQKQVIDDFWKEMEISPAHFLLFLEMLIAKHFGFTEFVGLSTRFIPEADQTTLRYSQIYKTFGIVHTHELGLNRSIGALVSRWQGRSQSNPRIRKAISLLFNAFDDLSIDLFKDSETDREDSLLEIGVDQAMMANDNLGGIDLNPDNVDLEIKRNNRLAPFEFDASVLSPTIIKIEGLYPVIINIVPMTNLPLFLGMTDQEPAKPFAADSDHNPNLTSRKEDLYPSSELSMALPSPN